MIDEKKLIEDLRKCYCGHSEMENSNLLMTFRGMCKIIGRQPKIGEWIPCRNGNLPENEVLCCDKHGEMMIGYVFETKDGTYNAESEHEYMYDCIAWMPKPELYKEDRKNEN